MAKRRGAGEGSVYRRKSDGRWVGALVTGTDENGKPRRKVVYGTTQGEVIEELQKLQADKRKGRLVEPSKLTVAKYLEEWLKDTVRPRVRATTAAFYKGQVKHINAHLGGVKLQNLTARHVKRLNTEMERQEVGARTRQAVHRTLHKAAVDAVKDGLIRTNPVAAVTAPRATPREIEPPTLAQIRRLLKEAAGRKIEALVVILATTGLRIGEALGQRWQDVNLEEGYLDVRHTLVEVDGQAVLTEPKTKRSRRRVELPERAVEALRAHRVKLDALPHPARPVFADELGGFLRRNNLMRRHWRPLLRAAGLRQFGFHHLRHAHATALLAAGANPRAVSERLGHGRPSLVLDLYGHVMPGAGRELAGRVDALLEASGEERGSYTDATRSKNAWETS